MKVSYVGSPVLVSPKKEPLLSFLSGGWGLSTDNQVTLWISSSPTACRLSSRSVCGIHPGQVCTSMYTRRRPVTSRTVSIRNTKIQPAKSELDSDLIQSGFWTGFEPLRRNVEDSEEHLFFSSPLTICKSLLPDPGGGGRKNLKGKAQQASRTSNSKYKTAFWWLACK